MDKIELLNKLMDELSNRMENVKLKDCALDISVVATHLNEDDVYESWTLQAACLLVPRDDTLAVEDASYTHRLSHLSDHGVPKPVEYEEIDTFTW